MARKRKAVRRRGVKTRVVLWFNAVLLAVMAGWFVMQPPARKEEVVRLVSNSFARNKNVKLVDVAWDIYQLYYSPDFVRVPTPEGDRSVVYGGEPRAVNYPHAIRVLSNEAYLAGYCDEKGNPLWAAYRSFDLSPLPTAPERPERFEVDRRTVARVEPGDYTHSGYDRGHLAPNHAIAVRHGEGAQRETFLMSNIIPQRHGLNAGLWKQLEMRIGTSYPARFGEVWVVAGPVFGERPARLAGKVAVPEGCFMIVKDESDGRLRTMAFIFPQDAAGELGDYLTTIEEIERRTGLDFLPELEEDVQVAVERQRASRVW